MQMQGLSACYCYCCRMMTSGEQAKDLRLRVLHKKAVERDDGEGQFLKKESMFMGSDENLAERHSIHYKKEPENNGMFGFLDLLDLKIVGALTFLGVIVRLAVIDNPSVVVFDEVHFGGFAAKYLRREFFFDLHPPLARLLVTLSGWLSGFRGDFNFHDIGVDYKRHGVPYGGMRVFGGVFGVATVPFAFLTVLAVGGSKLAAVCAALLVLFENSLVTQSRLILLDSYLIFFTAAALMFWALFTRLDRQICPSPIHWWGALGLTGLSLGCAASCKWVGLFTVASVGFQVILGLWGMWCNTLIPLKKIFKAFLARAACLIVVPLLVYIFTFWIHFRVLNEFSPAASSFTLQFQQNFAKGQIPPTNGPVYYGSTILLRQDRRDSPGYLHSHEALYPSGSKQQQVTIYHHQDANNLFVLKRPFVENVTYSENDLNDPSEEEELINLRHGDMVRLMHLLTGRFLHSHHEQAPLSNKKEHHAEVSCYGHDISHFSDLNDNWIVQIVGPDGVSLPQPPRREDSPIVNALKDRLIFLHPQAGCVLHSNNKLLPDWGFRQGEVTCGREVLKGHTYWKIEKNEHPLHENDEKNFIVEHRRAGFWEMFAELHGRMWVVNAGLKSPHYFQSWPKDWLFLRRGLGFWNGGQIPRSEAEIVQTRVEKDPKNGAAAAVAVVENDEEAKEAHKESYKQQVEEMKGKQIYLLGNLVTWHSVTLAILTMITICIIAVIIEQRIKFYPGFGSIRKLTQFVFEVTRIDGPVGFLLSSWGFHYFPFFLMGRQLFLHHYLPALYCGILFMCLALDKVIGKEKRGFVFTALVTCSILAFVIYAPLAYGTQFKWCAPLKLKSQWDWDCARA